jgi:23S rRNA pseudouridine1911/1915/1917 synthase
MEREEPRYRHRFLAQRAERGVRLDLALVSRFPGYSRSRLQRLVKKGFATVNGKQARPGHSLAEGDEVVVLMEAETRSYARPENISLDLLHEDPWMVVVNKPPGMTVHPGAGERRGTLANALAYRFGELSSVQGPLRPGIVHRLDKDTSGVLIVARNDDAHARLAAQFKNRTVHKTYLAVVHGLVEFDADLVSLPIGRHPTRPERMSIRHDGLGRASESYYEVRERFDRHTLVEVHPRTGRTHQIRVHMAALGHPLVSDRVYGRHDRVIRSVMPRQALHALRLEIRHPETGEEMTFEAPVPEDFEGLLDFLRGGGAAAPESLAAEMGVGDEEEGMEEPPAPGSPMEEEAGD